MSENLPARRAKISVKGLTTFQKIQLYHKEEPGRITLSEKEQEILSRWETAYKKLGKWDTKKEIANDLMKVFGLSHHQAMKDIRNAELLYKEELEVDVEIERGRLMEALRRGMKIAIKAKSPEEIAKISAQMIKATGMDKEVAKPLIDPEEIRPHDIILTTDPEVLWKQAEALRRKQMEMLAEDVDYEETKKEG